MKYRRWGGAQQHQCGSNRQCGRQGSAGPWARSRLWYRSPHTHTSAARLWGYMSPELWQSGTNAGV